MTSKKIIIYFSIILAIGIPMILVLESTRARPFDDHPANHLEELRHIPEVAAFYQKYGHHGVDVFPDGAFNYQVGFQARNVEEQWVILKINYRFGIPSSSAVFCTPDGIESQYRITDDVSGYLKEQNCFES